MTVKIEAEGENFQDALNKITPFKHPVDIAIRWPEGVQDFSMNCMTGWVPSKGCIITHRDRVSHCENTNAALNVLAAIFADRDEYCDKKRGQQ